MPEPVVEDGIDWAAVTMYAEKGGDEADIVLALGITEEQLREPAVAERMRRAVEKGGALKRLKLQVWADETAQKGGANTLLAELRNRLGWDKQTESQEAPPDMTSAHARLRLTLERLAKVKSAELGHEITAAHILVDIAFPKDEKVH